ncbi:hypothetical protein JOF41_001489 [Saccharothrix coeruleofusca]|nr:hypothetical protein [Saccharothrix coeruleofusca]
MRKGTPASRGAPRTRRYSRAQALALAVGLLQVFFAVVRVLPLSPANQVLHLCTGAAGIALSWRHGHARLYGVGLLLLYGHLFLEDMDTSTALLQLPDLEALSHGRTALAGAVIAVVPAFARR